MKEAAGILSGTTVEIEGQNKFAVSSDGCPEPEAFTILFDLGDKFIKLEMADLDSLVEDPFVKSLAVLTTTDKPTRECRKVIFKDTDTSREVDTFGESGHDYSDMSLRGFEPIERRCITTGTTVVASLALPVAELLLATTVVADEGVNGGIGDGEVIAEGIEAGKAVESMLLRRPHKLLH